MEWNELTQKNDNPGIYINEVLIPTALPFVLDQNLIFQNDNVKPQKCQLLLNAIHDSGIQVLR